MTPLLSLLAATVLTLAPPQGAVGGRPAVDPNQPIYTRQTLFAVPFRMNEGYQAQREAVQVFLYVSVDRGSSWQLHSRVEPEKGQFLFRAGSDGEYWFLIRTSRAADPRPPATGERPGLRVVVDTNPPKLELVAKRTESGQIVVRWQVLEPHVKPESFKVLYRTSADQPWESVRIDRPPSPGDGPVQVGEVTWREPAGGGRVEIRAELADQAGNTGVSHAQVSAGLSPAGIPQHNATIDRQTASPPSSTMPPLRPPQLNGPQGVPATPAVVARPATTQWRPIRQSSRRWSSDGERPSDAANSSSSMPSGASADPSQPARGNWTSEAGTPARQSPTSPLAATALAPSQAVGGVSSPRVVVVGGLSFTIEYEAASSALAEADRVEIWGTRDGRTWERLGADDDRQSPLAVSVPGEGLYGLRLSVSRGGMTSAAPPNGARPDLWVLVDRNASAAASQPPDLSIREVRSSTP